MMKSLVVNALLALPALAFPVKLKGNIVARAETLTVTVTATSTPTTAPKIKPKVFIVDLFTPEAVVWWGIPEFDLLANNITVPGLSPILPDAHCTADGQICQVVTGESEINAASTMSAISLSPLFDLTETYFLIGGIAGVNPACGTLGSVAFAKYAVQVGLAYEIDIRELQKNYSSPYFALGANSNDGYPGHIYGTEVFELNANLRDRAMAAASQAVLNDSMTAITYRKNYPHAPANAPPSVVAGDIETSDVFWHGKILGDEFEKYFGLLTNGSGKYCMTAQEDNAVMESLLRAALFKVVDFSRIISMRTAANFDRPSPGGSASQQLFYINSGGFYESTLNVYNAGIKVVEDIVNNWNSTFMPGLTPGNYVGDIFGSLKGPIPPDIGTPSSTIG